MEEQTYIPFIKPDMPPLPLDDLNVEECTTNNDMDVADDMDVTNENCQNYQNDNVAICPPCERVFENNDEMYATIQAEFDAELLTRYNAEYDTEDETGTLIKIRKLTETYVALFKKNVVLTPKSQSIIDHCEEFILKVKDRIREVCEHTIEEDDVEVGIDRIVHIIYCNRCESLFN